MASIYEEGGQYGERPPDIEESIYGPLEQRTLPEVVDEFPGGFNISPEAAVAIERGEKTELQVKEEKATALGMSLRDYLTEEEVAMDRAAWNEKIRAGVHPRTGEPLEGGGFEPPRTEKYGYGEHGRVDDLHAKGFKYGDKPPKNWKAPDYSPEGRLDWQNDVFKQIGGNPFTFNVNAELEKATQANTRAWFDQSFRGQVRYEDRHKLSKKQRDHWQTQLNRARAYAESDLTVQHDHMKFLYDVGMKLFDDKAEEFKVSEAAVNKKLGRMVPIFHPDKDHDMKVTMEELPTYEAEGWIRGTKKGTSDAVTTGDYPKAFKLIEDAFKEENLTPDGNIQAVSRRLIDEMLATMDLPTLAEMADVGAGEEELKGGVWNAIQDWWSQTLPGMALGARRPEITASGEQGAAGEIEDTGTTQAESATESVGEPTAVDASGAPYPDGTPGTYQGRPTVVQNGHWVFQ